MENALTAEIIAASKAAHKSTDECVYADANGICHQPRLNVAPDGSYSGAELYCRAHRRAVWGY